ncbi:hypothetical protein L1987_04298 [Smallanthus sonchifolius]|uniref:Uncharacterized protein n=1 Tax=Smallanthus sonchifolius TaxID=185202 RepID=A0ACB9KD20_9ASTR|nr:hypothetical protein L1987_04298 [Smallanthus sonchifolius]
MNVMWIYLVKLLASVELFVFVDWFSGSVPFWVDIHCNLGTVTILMQILIQFSQAECSAPTKSPPQGLAMAVYKRNCIEYNFFLIYEQMCVVNDKPV